MSEFLHTSSAKDNQQRAPPSISLGKEFQSLYEKEAGQKISEEKAQEYAEALINLVHIFNS